jgi:ubiquitin-conjugating enzyme E2 H
MQRQQRRRQADIAMLRSAGHLMHDDDASPSDDVLTCVLHGPRDTPYFGRRWRIRITLPAEYPFKSPSVGFRDPIFHPNVDVTAGSVCLNALNSEWTPMYKLTDIMDTLLPQLLTYPNADDPLNAHAAQLWQHDQPSFASQVCEVGGFVPPPPPPS